LWGLWRVHGTDLWSVLCISGVLSQHHGSVLPLLLSGQWACERAPFFQPATPSTPCLLPLSLSFSQPCYTARIHIVTETKPTKQRHQLCCFDTSGFTSTRTFAHISFIFLHISLLPSFTPLRHSEWAGKLQKRLKHH